MDNLNVTVEPSGGYEEGGWWRRGGGCNQKLGFVDPLSLYEEDHVTLIHLLL
jgi:hypothetical protein